MKCLKKSNLVTIILLLVVACSTNGFKITNQFDHKTELLVSPERIILTCPKVSEEEDIHLFIMPVLDDAQTVMLVIQSNNLSQEDCADKVI